MKNRPETLVHICKSTIALCTKVWPVKMASFGTTLTK